MRDKRKCPLGQEWAGDERAGRGLGISLPSFAIIRHVARSVNNRFSSEVIDASR